MLSNVLGNMRHMCGVSGVVVTVIVYFAATCVNTEWGFMPSNEITSVLIFGLPLPLLFGVMGVIG